MRRYLVSAVVLATLSAPAFAGGPSAVYDDPVVMDPVTNTIEPGDWTGFYVGGQLGFGNLDASGGLTDSGDGMIYGVHAGYDYDLGAFVVGAGVDHDFSDMAFTGNLAVDSVTRLKLRGGYDLGTGLIYATGGWARAESSGVVAATDDGWFAGLGYEHILSPTMSVAGEYLHHAFDDFDGSGVDVEANTMSARVSFRF